MISHQLRDTVDTVLRRELGTIGFQSAEIKEDVDHDGDDILRITIHYRKVGVSVDPTPTFGLVTALSDAIWEFGEDRFPHITHVFPEDQDLKVA